MSKYRDIQHEIKGLMKFGLVDSDYFFGEFTYEGQFISIDYEVDLCGVQIHNDYDDNQNSVLTYEQINKICSTTYQKEELTIEQDQYAY